MIRLRARVENDLREGISIRSKLRRYGWTRDVESHLK